MKLLQRLSFNLLVLCCAQTALALNVSLQDGTGPEFRWQGAIGDGQAIEIKGVNGEVRAEASNGQQVEVVAVKHWRRSAPETVNVEVVQHAGGVTICAIYPQRNGEPGHCKPGANGMSAYNNDVKVVPSILLTPFDVDKANYKAMVVDSGYIKEADLQ